MNADLASYGTEKQLAYYNKYQELKSHQAVADFFGVSKSVVGRAIEAMLEKARSAKAGEEGKKILVLPDVQAKPGVDFSYLRRIGRYALEKRPDVIVCIGDFADMPSLSSYDKGKKSFEGRRYKRDIEAAQFAMQAFLGPIEEYNKTARRPYTPRKVLTLGNHEHRIDRATNDDPMLEGILSIKDLAYEEYGWEVYPFLEVVVIEGIAFSHYFTTGVMGRPAGTAQAQLKKAGMSCFAGHQQGKQIVYGYRADGSTITSIISGSCYEHDESYLGPQGNKHWRGFWMLHDCKDGGFDEMPVSLSFINRRYPEEKFVTPAYSMPTEAEIQAGRM
jgi:hypothetical protein